MTHPLLDAVVLLAHRGDKHGVFSWTEADLAARTEPLHGDAAVILPGASADAAAKVMSAGCPYRDLRAAPPTPTPGWWASQPPTATLPPVDWESVAVEAQAALAAMRETCEQLRADIHAADMAGLKAQGAVSAQEYAAMQADNERLRGTVERLERAQAGDRASVSRAIDAAEVRYAEGCVDTMRIVRDLLDSQGEA